MDRNENQYFDIVQTTSEDDELFVRNGIKAYNTEKVSTIYDTSYESFNLIVKDASGTMVGGLVGRIFLASCFVELLWLDEMYRKHGLGTLLLNRTEGIARDKGCRFISLDTFSFQAPVFYKKLGFEVFGVLDGYPDGICRYYLKKTLSSAT